MIVYAPIPTSNVWNNKNLQCWFMDWNYECLARSAEISLQRMREGGRTIHRCAMPLVIERVT